MQPESPSIENVPLMHSDPIRCKNCEQAVNLAFTGEDEGVNICCDCYQMDTIPYYFKREDLPDRWEKKQ